MDAGTIGQILMMVAAVVGMTELAQRGVNMVGKVKLAPISRIFPNEAFGYRTITVERPQRDELGKVVLGTRGKQKCKPQPDSSLRATETGPAREHVAA